MSKLKTSGMSLNHPYNIADNNGMKKDGLNLAVLVNPDRFQLTGLLRFLLLYSPASYAKRYTR